MSFRRPIDHAANSEEEPQVSIVGTGALDDKVYTHPAYGCVSIFRTSGHRTLFGSDFKHQHYVSIEVHEAELHRGLAYDRHHPTSMVCRLAMSESQFAHFVSSVGEGVGTQCTFDYRPADDAHLIACPTIPHRDETDAFVNEGLESVGEALLILDALTTQLEGDLKGLSPRARAAALAKVSDAKSKISSTLPFVEKSFLKRVETRLTKAKTEMHAWMDSFVRRRGLQAIARETGMPLTMIERGDDGPDLQA